MERRDFMKMLALGTAATAGLAGMGIPEAFAAKKAEAKGKKKGKLSKQKEWAKKNYKGMSTLIFPSFTPDFKAIDEEGVRVDMANSIKHGFVGSMCFPVGTTPETHAQFTNAACDEAKGKKIFPADIIGEKTLEADLAQIALDEKNGCTHLLISPDRSGIGKTDDEIVEIYRKRCEATSLPVWIFAMMAPHYRKFGPSGVPYKAFDRIADFPNVVGVKYSHPLEMGTSFFLSELLADRLLISPVNFDFMPILMKFYGAQCSGQWSVEAIQSPEKPYAVDMMNAMLAGKWEEAHRLYNIIQPGLNDFFAMQAPCIRAGVSPWQHRKYLQWCVGGNGGLVYIADQRYQNKQGKLIPTLDQKERDYIKNWYRKIGIEPYDGPDEEFMVGKAAYKRGVRAKDLAHIQWYSEK